jgi:para-aminobenzoate synthetase component 1
VTVTILELDWGLAVEDALACFRDVPFQLLLDSARHHRQRDSRYSILTADPVSVVRLDTVPCGESPFVQLSEWQNLLQSDADFSADVPPFCGGIAGLLSYELGEAFERLPRPQRDHSQTPALLAGLFDWALVWDHLQQRLLLTTLQLPPSLPTRMSAGQRQQWVQQRLQERGRSDINNSAAGITAGGSASDQRTPPAGFHRVEPTSEIYSEFRRDEYVQTVQRVIEYIRAGDIFQANLSQRLVAPWDQDAVQLYRRVRAQNPAPFCGLLVHDDVAVISASPERFLQVDHTGVVETRPIKGTRRRLKSPVADLFAGNALIASPKDRAENVMIVDLLRNDLSRSCKVGSVQVTGLCEVERFATILHLVSTVRGELQEGRTVWDLLAGSFPGGSITGAPKIRAMEIIAELERSTRGAYCGSLFYCGPRGDFDSSILIRTFTLRQGWVHFPVGGGIVADSDPLDEYRETLHKASGMIRALRG